MNLHQPNKWLLLRMKFHSKRMFFRKWYWRLLGMKIGTKVVMGSIKADAPNAVAIGNHCELRSNILFWIKNPFDAQNNHIVIGDYTFIGENVEFNCCGRITIGNHCLIASSVIFVDSGHTFHRNQHIHEQPIVIEDIVLEDDVWIGSGAIILKGLTIGKGAVIGANSLVNKSIPPYEIWGGSPAKKIGERK